MTQTGRVAFQRLFYDSVSTTVNEITYFVENCIYYKVDGISKVVGKNI